MKAPREPFLDFGPSDPKTQKRQERDCQGSPPPRAKQSKDSRTSRSFLALFRPSRTGGLRSLFSKFLCSSSRLEPWSFVDWTSAWTPGLLWMISEKRERNTPEIAKPRVWKPKTAGFHKTPPPRSPTPKLPPKIHTHSPLLVSECIGVHSTMERLVGGSFGGRDRGFWGKVRVAIYENLGFPNLGFRNLWVQHPSSSRHPSFLCDDDDTPSQPMRRGALSRASPAWSEPQIWATSWHQSM